MSADTALVLTVVLSLASIVVSIFSIGISAKSNRLSAEERGES